MKHTATVIEPSLFHLWGRDLTSRELGISHALGWAVLLPYGIWRRTSFADRFDGQIYSDGALLADECDEKVCRFVDGCLLAPLDPFFSSFAKNASLRRMLTLVHLAMQGHVSCSDREGKRYFTAISDLPDLTELEDAEDIESLVRQGLICVTLNEAGDAVAFHPTPAAIFSREEAPDDPALDRQILLTLEKRGLMRAEKRLDGLTLWRPTERGRQFGLASKKLPAELILMALDIDDDLADCEARLAREAGEIGCTAENEPVEGTEEEVNRGPLFIIRPTKLRNLIGVGS